MKKYIKCGLAISLVTLFVIGCSSTSSSIQSHMLKEAEATTSPESSNVPQENVEYAKYIV